MTNHSTTARIGINDWLNTIANLIHKYPNRTDDRLYNPNNLSRALVYASLIGSLIIPGICFAFFVYPAMTNHATGKAQLASIPLLRQQVAQLKKVYGENRATLKELEADTSLTSLYDTTQAPYKPIELHRLAYHHRLTIVATDTLNDYAVSDRFIEHFTATRYSWHLKGQFVDYLTFKKALRDSNPLVQIEREHLSTEKNRQLNIIVDLNLYRAIEIAL